MNAMTRRQSLGLFATAAIPGAMLAAVPSLASEIAPEVSGVADAPRENPDLIEANDMLTAARAELTAAKDALAWLADEWRHRWPLAPEELLGGANANHGTSRDAERDIVGEYVMRDTSVLTTRLSREQRTKSPQLCFSVLTPDEVTKNIDTWDQRVPKGRTEKALESSRALRDKYLGEYKRKLEPARQYADETKRLRDVSGVQDFKLRVKAAERNVWSAEERVSKVPAFTTAGLLIKAKALRQNEIFGAMSPISGPFGELARFIQSVVDLYGTASA